MAEHAQIFNGLIEDLIGTFSDNEFDIIFTMAVLEHIHTDSEWIFSEMARIVNEIIITIEDEHEVSWRHFPRKYKEIFESLGMKQVEQINCSAEVGLNNNFVARVFRKNSSWN